MGLEEILRQAQELQRLLELAAKEASTKIDRQLAKTRLVDLGEQVKAAQKQFEQITTASGKMTKAVKENTNQLLNSIVAGFSQLSARTQTALDATSKQQTKQAKEDAAARVTATKAEEAEKLKVRQQAANQAAAVAKTTAVEAAKTAGQADRAARAEQSAATKAAAATDQKIRLDNLREAAKERARLNAAQTAADVQAAKEDAKLVGKVARDAAQATVDAQKRAAQDLANEKTLLARKATAEQAQLNAKELSDFRRINQEKVNEQRQANASLLESERSANRLDLAEEKGHQFRKSEAVKTGLDVIRTQIRNFVIRRREDQRHANRLEVIEDERKSKESLANLNSELHQKESLTRASIARQEVAQRAQTVSSQGVTGAALGRSNVGIGIRNLAFAGGGILSARSTFTIGADFAQALRVAQVQLSLTDDQMKKLRDTSIELGKAVDLPGVSAKDAAEAMLQLAKAGLTVDQTIGAAKGTLQLARAVDADFAESAFQVGAALNVFDIAAADSTKVADILAKTVALAGGTSFDDLSDAVRQSAAVFALNQKDVVGSNKAYAELNATLATLAKNGLRGQDAGTSLKQLILSLTSPSAAAKKQLDGLAKAVGVSSIAYDDATKKARPFTEQVRLLSKAVQGLSQEQRDAILGDIFGSDAVRAAAILTESADDLDATYKSILESQRTATTKGFAELLAAARNKGLRGAIDVLVSQIETFQIILFEKLEKPLAKAIFAIASGLDHLANDPAFEAIRRGLEGIAIAAAGLLIMKAAGEAAQFLALGLKALAFSPFALISVGILGLAFAVGFFAIKNKEFGKELAELAGNLALLGPRLLKDLLTGDLTAAANHLIDILKLIGNFPLIQLLGETIKTTGQLVVNTAVNLGKAIAAAVVTGFETAKELGPKILETVRGAIDSAATSAVALGKTILEKIGEGIDTARDNQIPQKVGLLIIKGINDAGRVAAQILTDDLTIKVVAGVAAALAAAAITIAGAFVAGFVQGLIQNRQEIVGALTDILSFAINNVLPILKQLILASPIWAQIIVGLAAIFGSAKLFSGLLTAFKGFQVNVRSGLAAMNGDFEKSRKVVAAHQLELRKTRVGELDALGSKLPSIGRAINQGLVTPFQKAATALRNWLTLTPQATAFKAPVIGPVQGPALPPPTTPVTSVGSFPAAKVFTGQGPAPVPTFTQPQNTMFVDPKVIEENARATQKAKIETDALAAAQARSEAASAIMSTAMLAATTAAIGYAAATSNGASKTLGLLTAIGTVAIAFATGGPVAAAFAAAAGLVGFALGNSAKKAAEAAAGIKRYGEILRLETSEARHAALVNDFTELFDKNDKKATHFINDFKGNFDDLADAILGGRDSALQYKAALIQMTAEQIAAGTAGERFFGEQVKFKDLIGSGKDYAEVLGIIKHDLEDSFAADFINEAIKNQTKAVEKQKLLSATVRATADEQTKLLNLATQDSSARKDALESQRDLFALMAGNKQSAINLALGLDSFAKDAKAIASAPADEQPRLRLELEKTRQELAGNFVQGAKDAIAAAAAIGESPVTAVQAYRKEVRDHLINDLKLSEVEADALLSKLDEFSDKRVKTEIDLQLTENAKDIIATIQGLLAANKIDLGVDLGATITDLIPHGGGSTPPGFAQGGIIRRQQIITVGERGKPEVIIPLTDPARATELVAQSGLLSVLAQDQGNALQSAALTAARDDTLKAIVTVKGGNDFTVAPSAIQEAATAPSAPVVPATLPPDLRNVLNLDVAALTALADAANKAAAALADSAHDSATAADETARTTSEATDSAEANTEATDASTEAAQRSSEAMERWRASTKKAAEDFAARTKEIAATTVDATKKIVDAIPADIGSRIGGIDPSQIQPANKDDTRILTSIDAGIKNLILVLGPPVAPPTTQFVIAPPTLDVPQFANLDTGKNVQAAPPKIQVEIPVPDQGAFAPPPAPPPEVLRDLDATLQDNLSASLSIAAEIDTALANENTPGFDIQGALDDAAKNFAIAVQDGFNPEELGLRINKALVQTFGHTGAPGDNGAAASAFVQDRSFGIAANAAQSGIDLRSTDTVDNLVLRGIGNAVDAVGFATLQRNLEEIAGAFKGKLGPVDPASLIPDDFSTAVKEAAILAAQGAAQTAIGQAPHPFDVDQTVAAVTQNVSERIFDPSIRWDLIDDRSTPSVNVKNFDDVKLDKSLTEDRRNDPNKTLKDFNPADLVRNFNRNIGIGFDKGRRALGGDNFERQIDEELAKRLGITPAEAERKRIGDSIPKFGGGPVPGKTMDEVIFGTPPDIPDFGGDIAATVQGQIQQGFEGFDLTKEIIGDQLAPFELPVQVTTEFMTDQEKVNAEFEQAQIKVRQEFERTQQPFSIEWKLEPNQVVGDLTGITTNLQAQGVDLGLDLGATIAAQIPQGFALEPITLPEIPAPVVAAPEIPVPNQEPIPPLEIPAPIQGPVLNNDAITASNALLAETQSLLDDIALRVIEFTDLPPIFPADQLFFSNNLLADTETLLSDLADDALILGFDMTQAIEGAARLSSQLDVTTFDARQLFDQLSLIARLSIVVPVTLKVDTADAKARVEEFNRSNGVIGNGAQIIDIGGAAKGKIITHEQLLRVGEGGRKEVVIPLEDADRAFALMVATGLDKLVASRDTTVSQVQAPVQQAGPLIGELHVNEVAGDPVATGIVAGSHIARKIQGALV